MRGAKLWSLQALVHPAHIAQQPAACSQLDVDECMKLIMYAHGSKNTVLTDDWLGYIGLSGSSFFNDPNGWR